MEYSIQWGWTSYWLNPLFSFLSLCFILIPTLDLINCPLEWHHVECQLPKYYQYTLLIRQNWVYWLKAVRATTTSVVAVSQRRNSKVGIYWEFEVWLKAGLSVPGAGWRMGWRLELDWVKIMKNQSSIDENRFLRQGMQRILGLNLCVNAYYWRIDASFRMFCNEQSSYLLLRESLGIVKLS